MKFPFSGQILDIVKGAVSTVGLFLAYVFLPVVGMPAGMMAPLPAAFFTLKSGKMTGAAIVALSTILFAAVADAASVLLYVAQAAVISLLLPFLIERGVGGMRSIVSTVAVNMLLLVIAVAVYGAVNGVNVNALIQKGIEASISQTASLYEKAGVKGQELEAFKQAMQQAGALITRVYPALVVMALGSIAGVTLALLVRMQEKLPRRLDLGQFRSFKNPDHFIWILIAAGFGVLIGTGIAKDVALNALIVAVTLYFFQGLAIVQFYFQKLSTPGILRYLFYLFLAIQPYLAVAVAAFGVFDLWGNFRVPRKT